MWFSFFTTCIIIMVISVLERDKAKFNTFVKMNDNICQLMKHKGCPIKTKRLLLY